MSEAKSELLKKLLRYPKKDIIEAIGRQCQAERLISGIVNDIECQMMQRALEDCREAANKLLAARKAYHAWCGKMCARYGDGKTVRLTNIPREDLECGEALEETVKELAKAEQTLDRKFNKLAGVGTLAAKYRIGEESEGKQWKS